jgi:Flp pilus assembly protein TadD
MSTGAQRAALEAVHSARPIVARLSSSRNSEDLAADIIEAWTAVESGLRSLVGGSALTGQMLIRELRQRHFLTLEQANSLAEFHAARERASRTEYKPTDGDVNAARDAFLKLEAGLMGDAPTVSRSAAPAMTGAATAAAAAATPREPSPLRTFTETTTPSPVEAARAPAWRAPLLALLGLLVVGGLAWWALAGRGGGSAAYDQGVAAYRDGRREAAEGDFVKATKDQPTDPMPHVYLARIARESGRLSTAQEEAVKAVSLGPNNAAALRELASVSFAQQNYDAARRFYIRALQVDGNDRLSQGYLGCSLVRLGRLDEGTRWIQRAGNGPWSNCAPAPGTTTPNGQIPVGGQASPGQYPGGTQPAYPRS